MRSIVLHSPGFEENWAHYYFYRDPDFLGTLAESGFALHLSKDLAHGRDAAAVLYLDAFAAGSGSVALKERVVRQLRWRLRPRSIPRHVGWDPESCRRPFTMLRKGDRGYFDAGGAARILLAIEGVMHAPDSHNPSAHEQFDGVLTWNPAFGGSRRVHHYRIPQPAAWAGMAPLPFRERKLLTSISADKRIAHPLELYTARRESIWALSRRGAGEFEFYGMGWSRLPRHVACAYQGEAKSKGEIFSRYRFALVYENAAVPGYVSEKIFDAMRSKCVPVYLGAPDAATCIPRECFIDRRDFSCDADLMRFLSSMSEREYEFRQEAMGEFLTGPGFRPFLAREFGRRVVGVVAAVSGS